MTSVEEEATAVVREVNGDLGWWTVAGLRANAQLAVRIGDAGIVHGTDRDIMAVNDSHAPADRAISGCAPGSRHPAP